MIMPPPASSRSVLSTVAIQFLGQHLRGVERLRDPARSSARAACPWPPWRARSASTIPASAAIVPKRLADLGKTDVPFISAMRCAMPSQEPELHREPDLRLVVLVGVGRRRVELPLAHRGAAITNTRSHGTLTSSKYSTASFSSKRSKGIVEDANAPLLV